MTGRAVVEVAIFTDDVEAVRAFYESVLGVAPAADWPGGAVFSAGDVKLLVHERAATTADGPANEDHVAFSVADVDRACDELRADGIDVLGAPRDYPWGRSAYLRDPDGRMLELSQA
jgi:catechol 2,3-dioxygenase-like lactoylglutathione lyase family enzyme